MSLVTEILSSAGELEKENLETKIQALNRQISQIKNTVQESLQKRYVDFLPLIVCTSELEFKVTSYTSEIQSLSNLIKNEIIGQIQESTEEFQLLNKELVVMDTALQVIKKTIEAHDSLEKCDVAFQQQNFIESVHCLQKVNSLLTSLSPVWEGRVEILKGLKTEYAVHREKLKYDMGEMWKNYLKWDIPELLEGERETGPTVLTLFKSREGKILPLESLANAMHSLGYLGTVLKVFGKQLQKHALEPIIVRQVEVDVVRSEDNTILKLKSRGVGPIVLPPVEVFQKLTTVLECLHDSFGKVVLNGVEEGSSQCLMRKLGEIIYKDFCDTLVKECLSPAIPSHRKAMSEYNKIVDAVTNFHAMLVTIEFLKPDDESILHYAQNVDALFAAKLCQDYLGRARKIMLEDLYDCISVQEAVSPINKCSVKSGMKSEAVSSSPEMTDPYPKDFSDKKYSSVNLLKFPQCRISKSTAKLVEMLYEIMEEAVASAESASRLYVTARNIVDLYCDIVPCYHKDSLETLPQQSALLHNSCMCIAHHLMTMGHTFRKRFPEHFNTDLVTFVDLIPKVRNVGISTFLSQMRCQRKQLLDMLGEAQGFQTMIGDSKTVSSIRRAFKQCLLRLQQLGNVWRDVLPQNVYMKAIGTLVNTLVEEAITRVLVLEDLPADSAVHLIGIFGLITDVVPNLFKLSEDDIATVHVQKYVSKWLKFNELVFVLDATMQDILDRWASGKGPLAQDFTADEIKHLVRALFQNTDHRAAVLVKIK